MSNGQATLHERCGSYDPIHAIDAQTGATLAVFYVGSRLAASCGLRGAGWFWAASRPGLLRGDPPNGPFTTAYTAFRAALTRAARPGDCS
jgi:hypothetical protein